MIRLCGFVIRVFAARLCRVIWCTARRMLCAAVTPDIILTTAYRIRAQLASTFCAFRPVLSCLWTGEAKHFYFSAKMSMSVGNSDLVHRLNRNDALHGPFATAELLVETWSNVVQTAHINTIYRYTIRWRKKNVPDFCAKRNRSKRKIAMKINYVLRIGGLD